jgi:hypothetical protein
MLGHHIWGGLIAEGSANPAVLVLGPVRASLVIYVPDFIWLSLDTKNDL